MIAPTLGELHRTLSSRGKRAAPSLAVRLLHFVFEPTRSTESLNGAGKATELVLQVLVSANRVHELTGTTLGALASAIDVRTSFRTTAGGARNACGLASRTERRVQFRRRRRLEHESAEVDLVRSAVARIPGLLVSTSSVVRSKGSSASQAC